MAEIATIARPYAEALFEASTADLQGASGWLERLAAIAGDPQVLQLADNPKVGAAQVQELISGVFGAPLPAHAQNLLSVLIENGRLAALPEIAVQFRQLANAHGGTADAVVHSAFPIDGAALAQVEAALERRFGCKLNVSVQLDPSLIGGIRAVVGDEVLDTSVKARLEQMKMALVA
jgi:F-type H+-transporting ATPase subunit delta